MGFAIATALAQSRRQCRRRLLYRARRHGQDRRRLLSRAPTRSNACARLLSAHGTRVYAAHLDVRDSEVTNRFVAEAQAAIGPADILVNAAGTTAEQPVCGHSDALWDKIVDTNLTGAFRVTRAVLPGMIERGWGRIVNIGSTAASVGWKDNPAYCASKAGLLGLTRCVALEGAAARRHLRHDQPDLGRDRTDAPQCGAGRRA